jgi:hypothetical protein
VVCIYRAPTGTYEDFLDKLEKVICSVQVKRKRLILCGDWNVNLLQQTPSAQELRSLLLMHNLVNIADSPTRYSRNVNLLIDVIVIDNLKYDMHIRNVDIGYSDHLAQILYINVHKIHSISRHIKKRFFTDMNIAKFNSLLQDGKWDKVLQSNDVNLSYNLFIYLFSHYFNMAFPKISTTMRKNMDNRWVTKGILISRNRMFFLTE